MRRTRRFKRRQQWLPVYGNGGAFSEGQVTGNALGGTVNLVNDGTEAGGIDWLASPLTFDTQISPEDAQNTGLGVIPPTIRDLVAGSEWSLRRIVGKLFVTVRRTGFADPSARAPAIECGAGIIVCNTDEEGIPLTDFDEVNPLTQDSAEDPWVWERHWLLRTTIGQTTWNDASGALLPNTPLNAQLAAEGLPISNVGYGSRDDGPHVDQKTVRRIRRDQRLFMVVATRPSFLIDNPTFDTDEIEVNFRWMLRLLGNVRSASGNRGNAAR